MLTDDQIVLVVASYALRDELRKVMEGVEERGRTRPYAFPDDVPAERITDLLDFLWNLLREVRIVQQKHVSHTGDGEDGVVGET